MKQRVAVLLLPTLAAIGLIWLPFGFHMGGLIEEWGLYALYVQQGPMFFAGAHTAIPIHQMRPLLTTLSAIAYAVDSDSWWFWHLELLLTLLIRGAAFSWIALYLTGSRRWAMIGGLLFVLWPADTMQMAFRGIIIALSSGLVVLSAAFFLAAFAAEGRARRLAFCLAGAVSFLMGSLQYELTLMLAPLPLMLIYARDGFAGALAIVRRRMDVTIAWCATIGIGAGYMIAVELTAKQTYQDTLIGDRHQLAASLITNAPALFSHGYVRSLFGGWVDAARILAHDFPSHWYFALVACVFLLVILALSGRENDAGVAVVDKGGAWRGRVALVGAVALALGYAPFLVNLSHVAISQRIFLFASIGAVLMFLPLLVLIERLNRTLALAAAVALLTLGAAQQLFQFREYTANYESQRKVLRAIIEQAPDLPPGKTLVVLDASDSINHTWMLALDLSAALTYLYNKPVAPVQACLTPLNEWVHRNASALSGQCIETPDSWIFRSAPVYSGTDAPAVQRDADVVLAKADAVVVRINADSSAPSTPDVAMNRKALGSGSAAVARRYRAALGPDPWPSVLGFLYERPGPTYRWDFGHRWSLEHAEPGSGWGEADWTYQPFRQVSSIWMDKPQSTLVFRLKPANADYALDIHLIGRADERMPDALSVKVNGAPATVHWADHNNVTAEVPAGRLQDGMNLLEFATPVAPGWGISLKFDSLNLHPIGRP